MNHAHVPVSYEVTIAVRADLVPEWEKYLPEHVLDILATGCFKTGTIERNEAGQYRCRYVAASHGELDRYLSDHATALRAEALKRFPEGVEATRAVWMQWRVMAR